MQGCGEFEVILDSNEDFYKKEKKLKILLQVCKFILLDQTDAILSPSGKNK